MTNYQQRIKRKCIKALAIEGLQRTPDITVLQGTGTFSSDVVEIVISGVTRQHRACFPRHPIFHYE